MAFFFLRGWYKSGRADGEGVFLFFPSFGFEMGLGLWRVFIVLGHTSVVLELASQYSFCVIFLLVSISGHCSEFLPLFLYMFSPIFLDSHSELLLPCTLIAGVFLGGRGGERVVDTFSSDAYSVHRKLRTMRGSGSSLGAVRGGRE